MKNLGLSAQLILRATTLPLAALAIFLLIIAIYRLAGLPEGDELLTLARSSLSSNGYAVVFLAALIEALLLINLYLPGSAVIIFSGAIAKDAGLSVNILLLYGALGLLTGFMIDYVLGRFGWYHLAMRLGLGQAIESSKKRIQIKGLTWFWVAYIHPNTGSFAATAVGVMRVPFSKFFLNSIPPLLCWSTFWGYLSVFVGPTLFDYIGFPLVALVFLIWIVGTLWQELRKARTVDE